MDNSSFISSFRSFRRLPAAALFAVALFAVAEIVTTIAWRPDVVGKWRYENSSPTYDYGYSDDVPRLFRVGEMLRYYPTEYVNIRPFFIRERKRSDEIRIFTVGGSVSRGTGLPFGSDYSSQLEAMLTKEHPEYDWQVVNLSADGFGTTRMLRVITNMVKYEPDAIILHPHGSNEFEDERDARYREQLLTGLNGLILRSRFLVLLKKLEIRKLRLDDPSPAEVGDEATANLDPENVRRWLETIETNVERSDCVVGELGVPSIYVGRAERDAESFRSERVERLNGPIRNQPHFLDVAEALAQAAEEYPEAELFEDNTHYDELGHRIVARELYARLRPGGSLFDRVVARNRRSEPLRPKEIAARCSTLRAIGEGGKEQASR